ncbi:tetratricopeptide repeat protein [candidate division CSSED10-310 bacterium]|uniref:Tetratricopeptide repeat protein n=1 Tax=candidate division CSSED10-310 bacterium TaxID=2855610 RepID=A0ABV6Z4D5_UNCC1
MKIKLVFTWCLILSLGHITEAVPLLYPEHISHQFSPGIDLINKNKLSEALDYFNDQLDQNAGNAEINFFLSIIFRRLNHYGYAAHKVVEASMLDDRILVPCEDLLIELGWEIQSPLHSEKSYSFLPRYRIDDVLSLQAKIEIKSIWEENNQLLRKQGALTLSGEVLIGNPEKEGLISAQLWIKKISPARGLPFDPREFMNKKITFLFSPIFGFLEFDEYVFISDKQKELVTALLRSLFPAYPPKFMSLGERTIISEANSTDSLYVGAVSFDNHEGSSADINEKLILSHYSVPAPYVSSIERTITLDLRTSLPRIIIFRCHKTYTSDNVGSNHNITYDITVRKLNVSRGRVELPLYPTTIILSESQDREKTSPPPVPETASAEGADALVYKLPEFQKMEHSESSPDKPDPMEQKEIHSPKEEKENALIITNSDERKASTDEAESKHPPPSVLHDPTPTPMTDLSAQNTDTPSYDDLIVHPLPRQKVPESTEEQLDDQGDQESLDYSTPEKKKEVAQKIANIFKDITLPPPPISFKTNTANPDGESDSSIPLLENKLQKDPDNQELKVTLGIAYLRKGYSLLKKDILTSSELIDQARKEFQSAVEIDPENTKLYLDIGSAWFNVLMYQDALSYFQTGLNKEKKVEAYLGAALCYAELGKNFIKSVVLAKRALYKEKSWPVYLTLGWIYFRKDDYGWAVEEYNKAFEAGGNSQALYFYRALALLKNGQVGPAKKDFGKVVQMDSQNTYGLITTSIMAQLM